MVDHSSEDPEVLVDRAIVARNDGRLEEAVSILESIVSNVPGNAVAQTVLGGIYWDQERSVDALRCFTCAIEANPTLEMASLPIFHIYMEMDEVDKAFAEMRRFLSLAESQEYQRLIYEFKRMNRKE